MKPALDKSGKNRRVSWGEGLGLLALYAALVIFFALASPYFLSLKNFLNIGLAASIIGIISIAMTAVIISGGIDLSVGSVVALAGVITTQLYGHKYGIFISVAGGALVGLAVGLLNGVLVTRININALIATLGTMSMARGLAFVLSGGLTNSMPHKGFQVLGRGYLFGVPNPLILMVILFGIAYWVMRHTVFGRQIYAVGGNPQASRLAGIGVDRVRMVIYLVSGLAAALGGLVLTSQLAAGAPQAASGIELSVVAAVILGGTSLYGGKGSLVGTLLGVLIMGTVNNGLVLLNVSSYYQEVARGAVLLLAVAADQLRARRS